MALPPRSYNIYGIRSGWHHDLSMYDRNYTSMSEKDRADLDHYFGKDNVEPKVMDKNTIKKYADLVVDNIHKLPTTAFVFGKYYRDVKLDSQVTRVEVSVKKSEFSTQRNMILQQLGSLGLSLDNSTRVVPDLVEYDGALLYTRERYYVRDKRYSEDILFELHFVLAKGDNPLADERIPEVNTIWYNKLKHARQYSRSFDSESCAKLNAQILDKRFTIPTNCPTILIKELLDSGWKADSPEAPEAPETTNNMKTPIKIDGPIATTDETIKETKKMTVMDFVKDRGEKAMYRVVSRNVTRGVKAATLKLLKAKGMDDGNLGIVTMVLETEFGDAILSAAIGALLGVAGNSIPMIKKDARLAKLAEEMQVEGGAVLTDAVVKEAMQYFLPVILEAMSTLPAETTNTRIESDEVEEDHIEETAKVKK